MMKAFSLLPLVAAYQVMDTQNHVDVQQQPTGSFDGMKSMLKGISAKQKKGEKIDGATIQAVEQAIASINEELMEALGEDVTRTQTMLDNARDDIISCDTTKTNWVGNGHAADTAAQASKKGEHETCRTREGELCDDATKACDALSGQVCGWNHCPKPAADSWVNGDTDAVNHYMLCLEEFFQEQNGTYYNNKANCLERVSDWHNKATECDEFQETFESAFCESEHGVETACKQYRECRDEAQGGYQIVRERVQDLEEVYQTQRVALHTLECYGTRILNNDTDLSECEQEFPCCSLGETVNDKFETDCPFIVYHAIPPCIGCSEPDPVNPERCTMGGKGDFVTTYYGQYDSTCTPAAQCLPCAASHPGFTENEGARSCEVFPAGAGWEEDSQACE